MCTVVVLVRPGHDWPLLLAANRDERIDRAWDPPAEFWPGIVGGRDALAGGTWMAANRAGVVACVLNRSGSLGPAPGKRSRGELPLLALAGPTAAAGAAAIARLDSSAWRSFNLLVADRDGAIFLRGPGHGALTPVVLAPGVHMLTAEDPDDPASPRIARHLPRFRTAPPPEADDWAAWRAILADRSGPAGTEVNVPPRGGFGTVCASLFGLGPDGMDWRFAAGAPDAAGFAEVGGVAGWAGRCYTRRAPGSGN